MKPRLSAGDVISTSYGSGPYIVLAVTESHHLYCAPCGTAHFIEEPAWNILAASAFLTPGGRTKWRLFYVNGVRGRDDGRIFTVPSRHIPNAKPDEIIIDSRKEGGLTEEEVRVILRAVSPSEVSSAAQAIQQEVVQVKKTPKNPAHKNGRVKVVKPARGLVGSVRALKAKPKAAPKARKKKGEGEPAAEKTPRSIAYVTPGKDFITVATFATLDRAEEHLSWAKDAMKKAAGEKGTVDFSDIVTLKGGTGGLLFIAKLAAEKKAYLPFKRTLRTAAKDALRDAGYIVRR